MSLDKMMGWFSVDMGIDLGTCNTLVCVRGEGMIHGFFSNMAITPTAQEAIDFVASEVKKITQ